MDDLFFPAASSHPTGGPRTLPSAYYTAVIADFCLTAPDVILGRLTTNSAFAVETTQRNAWVREIELLREALTGISGDIALEYVVPRLGSRIDSVVLAGGIIFVLEFKVGDSTFSREAVNQVWDYALDLKNFHAGSHDVPIVPILVATEATSVVPELGSRSSDGIFKPICTSPSGLATVLGKILSQVAAKPIDSASWAAAPYHPTPTIIQAAQALYSRHSVEAISRQDAGAHNLAITSRRVEELIERARSESRKFLVLVTGVPGAGKTLVGLDVATRRRDETRPAHAIFLSGNGPLVEVLREALVRDELARQKAAGRKARKGNVDQKVKAFIQNVHHFRDAGLADPINPPVDHVAIFDEAQRAWNQTKTADFMRRRKGFPNFSQSEPEFLLSYMDRHQDWAVVVCLVGGGQEINVGEAGISAWLDAVQVNFPHWATFVSTNLSDSEYAAEESIVSLGKRAVVTREAGLHLNVSMRSFRSENVSRLIKAILDGEQDVAKQLVKQVQPVYPILLTRSLAAAKRWLRRQARGTQRFGLIASSGATRLKPHAIDVRYSIKPKDWFLNGPDDTRSSWYLEDVATEFHIQGLELDWVLMSWDADLMRTRDGWKYRKFRVDKWTQVKKPENQRYLLNAYRVLLTRARQGLVNFIPEGDEEDPTRLPALYDPSFEYLHGLGIPLMEEPIGA